MRKSLLIIFLSFMMSSCRVFLRTDMIPDYDKIINFEVDIYSIDEKSGMQLFLDSISKNDTIFHDISIVLCCDDYSLQYNIYMTEKGCRPTDFFYLGPDLFGYFVYNGHDGYVYWGIPMENVPFEECSPKFDLFFQKTGEKVNHRIRPIPKINGSCPFIKYIFPNKPNQPSRQEQ